MSTFTTLKYAYLSKYACSKLAQKRLMLQDGPRVIHFERLAAIPTRLSHWHSHKKHMNLVQVLAMSRFCWIVPYYVRKLKNLCMITKLQYTCLNGQCRYACSTVAQQRLMRQDGPRVTHPSPQNATGMQPSAFGGFTTHANGYEGTPYEAAQVGRVAEADLPWFTRTWLSNKELCGGTLGTSSRKTPV